MSYVSHSSQQPYEFLVALHGLTGADFNSLEAGEDAIHLYALVHMLRDGTCDWFKTFKHQTRLGPQQFASFEVFQPESSALTRLPEVRTTLFDAFIEKLAEISESNPCDCAACQSMQNWQLEIFVTRLVASWAGDQGIAGQEFELAKEAFRTHLPANVGVFLGSSVREFAGEQPEVYEEPYRFGEKEGMLSSFVAPEPKFDYHDMSWRVKTKARLKWLSRAYKFGLKKPF